jgi:hypothetical protein
MAAMKGVVLLPLQGDRHPLAGATNTNESTAPKGGDGGLIRLAARESIKRYLSFVLLASAITARDQNLS